MVSLVKKEHSPRERILRDLFHLATLLQRIKAHREPLLFVSSTMKSAVQRMFNTLAKADWQDQTLTLRSLNMSLRGLIYDIMEEEPQNLPLYRELLQYSRSMELELRLF